MGESKTTKFRDRGYTLIEVIMSLAVLSMVSLAITSSNLQLSKNLQKSERRAKVDQFRQNLINLSMSTSSWNATLKGNLNAGDLQNCASYGSGTTQNCVPGAWQGGGGSGDGLGLCSWFPMHPNCQPSCTTVTMPNVTTCPLNYNVNRYLSLYDASGVLYYNARNPNNGFTDTGDACGPDAAPPFNAFNYGTAQCPYRMRLRWYGITNETAPNKPVIAITGTLEMIPNHDPQLNTTAYSIPVIYRSAQ